jgi:pSer/pThr/pTyr-binding forkhead associated (FHA) protein
VDIFTTGISVDPNFGEFEDDLRRQDEEQRAAKAGVVIPSAAPPMPDIQVIARINQANNSREVSLTFKPGGKRLNVGRASDNELRIIDDSVSKIHAALLMTSEGTLLVADTGSTNGTFINGRRIAYGESRLIEAGDVVGFGDVEVRLRKSE